MCSTSDGRASWSSRARKSSIVPGSCDSHVMGFTLWQVGIDRGLSQLPGTIDDFLARLDQDALPSLAEHIEQHLRPEVDGVSEFDFGLGLLLDGLERLRLRELEDGSAAG